MNLTEMSEDEINDGSGEEDGEEEGEAMSGWADSMAKILKSTKPKNKKELMLSRARKDYEVSKQPTGIKSKKGDDIEIEKSGAGESAQDDKEGDEKVDEDSNVLSMKQQRKLELRQRKLERAWENLNRMTTEAPDRELEDELVKVATKGVVQLFNAVAQQQKTLKTKLKASRKSEFKKEKVLSQSKDMFDQAMNKSKIIRANNNETDSDSEIKEEEVSSDNEPRSTKKGKRKATGSVAASSSKKPVWQALQDDFMLDAKLKDWDQDSGDSD